MSTITLNGYKLNHNLHRGILIFTLLFLICLPGCARFLGFTTYYDPTTYKNLTDLKPKVSALYDTFTRDSVEVSDISAIRLNLAQIYEYEKGKGIKNSETSKQISIIQNMYEEAVKDRLSKGKWSDEHLSNKKQNIMDAFDIAIQTENLKNKNEQGGGM